MFRKNLVLNLQDVASLLGRSPETIRKDVHRNPAAVPPRLIIPGTRLLRWRSSDVRAWLAKQATSSTEGGHAQ